MEIFGVGGGELLLLMFLGGIVLGPRRLMYLLRESRRMISQVQGLARNLTDELDREITKTDAAELKAKTESAKTESEPQSESAPEELPEAYRRFAADFPEEALPEPTPPTPSVAQPVVAPQPTATATPAPITVPVRAAPPPVRAPSRVGASRAPSTVNPLPKENGNTPPSSA